jgi:hypothetical protein
MADTPHFDDGILAAKVEEVEAALRPLGLYFDRARWLHQEAEDEGDRRGAKDGTAILVASFMVGDLAFSARVQDPQQSDFDSSFRAMAAEMRREETEELIRKMASGDYDPFADD